MVLVRDVMTIGVPVCRETETCEEVRARLQAQPATAAVALDEDGMACGWLTLAQLAEAPASQPVGEVMDEAIPTAPPDLPAAAAAQIMRDRGVDHLFLMHDWPGEPRPSAVVTLQAIENKLRGDGGRP